VLVAASNFVSAALTALEPPGLAVLDVLAVPDVVAEDDPPDEAPPEFELDEPQPAIASVATPASAAALSLVRRSRGFGARRVMSSLCTAVSSFCDVCVALGVNR
jgi:hypothetical protein